MMEKTDKGVLLDIGQLIGPAISSRSVYPKLERLSGNS